jgi:hypothetical protein
MKLFFVLTLNLLLMVPGDVTGASSKNAESPGVRLSDSLTQDNAQDGNTSAHLSGNWQISWVNRNGESKQAKLQIRQDGSKLSGKFQAERGSAPVTGNLQGDQVSLTVKARGREVSFEGTVNGDKMSGTTKQGKSWNATRQ